MGVETVNRCPGCGAAEGELHRYNCITRPMGLEGYLGINSEPTPAPLTVSLPPEVEQYRHDIRRFVEAMIYKLGLHANKGKWEDYSIPDAIGKLEGEVAELTEAALRGNMVEVMLEAADVANYALIASAIAMERGK